MKIEVGGFYKQRNGLSVFINHKETIKFGVGGEYVYYVGILIANGWKNTWGYDGKFSPVCEGPQDLIAVDC